MGFKNENSERDTRIALILKEKSESFWRKFRDPNARLSSRAVECDFQREFFISPRARTTYAEYSYRFWDGLKYPVSWSPPLERINLLDYKNDSARGSNNGHSFEAAES
jgi:hypothetical protein